MKTKIEMLFEDFWRKDYELIRNIALNPERTARIQKIGRMTKKSFQIEKKQFKEFADRAKENGIEIILSEDSKLSYYLSKNKEKIKVEDRPLKIDNQFLLTDAKTCYLYVFNEEQQALIQFIFEFFQKKGSWPFGSEILVGLERTNIIDIIETLPKDELVIYIQHEEKYRLTPFGVIHAKGSKPYMRALDYVAKELKEGIQNGLEKMRFNYEEIPELGYIKNIPKNQVASFLMGPWQAGGSITDEYFEIDVPKDVRRSSLILKYTNPISFCRERYVKNYDQVFDGLDGISTLPQIESLASKGESSSFNLDFLEEDLKERCLDLFNIEKYDVVIFNACKVIEVRTRNFAQLKETDYGVDLMRKAFNPKNPKLKYSEIPAEQESVMHLFAGFIGTFKNPNSHRFEDIDDPQRAFEILNFANNLCKILNESTKVQ